MKENQVLIEKLDALKKNPIFIMSLSSKELFHSNMWAFFIENDVRYFKVFFPENEIDDSLFTACKDIDEGFSPVFREEENRDLTIYSSFLTNQETNEIKYLAPFVIENKIKSIPTVEQLQRYENDLKGKNKPMEHGLLTGAAEEEPFILPNNWSYLSYSNIAKNIKKITEDIQNQKDFKCEEEIYQLAIDYANMIENLGNSLNEVRDNIGEKYLFICDYRKDNEEENFGVIKKLSQMRIIDIVQKMNAELFISSVSLNDSNISKKSGFTHGCSFAEFSYDITQQVKKNQVKRSCAIGVQIQERQFRWFVINNFNDQASLTKKEKEEAIMEKYGQLGWFDKEFQPKTTNNIKSPFDANPLSTSLGNRKKNTYGKFWAGQELFIYQYCDITDNSFDSLKSQVANCMKKAKEIFDKEEK